VRFADNEFMTFLKEKDLGVGLSCNPSDPVPGTRRFVRSPSCAEFLSLKLCWGMVFVIDDFGLAELGLGGSPALVELGLADMLILVEVGTWLSNVLSGICRERFGLRELFPCALWALSSRFGTYMVKQKLLSITSVQ
jgi:hypothetical protein